MPQYLILYRSTTAPDEQMGMSPGEMQAEMDKWNAWGQSVGDALVDFGNPTRPTSDDDPGPAGWIGGYSLLQADDEASLQALLAEHPHRPFGTIEVLEVMPMPGQ
jgi:hypothetical protein